MSQFENRLFNAMHAIAALVGIPALVVVVGVDVFLRYVLNAPLLWGAEVSALLLLVTFFASLPHCTAHDGHIRMELLYDRMSPAGKAVADMVSALCGLVVAGMLAWHSFVGAAEMYRYNEGAEMIDISYWPFAVLMGLSACLLCLRFLTLAIAVLRRGGA